MVSTQDKLSKLEVTELFYNISARISYAMCSMYDPEVNDEFIYNMLYSALYEITELLLRQKGRTPPRELRYRLYQVRDLYGSSYVPTKCFIFAQPGVHIYRDEMAEVGQILERWWERERKNYLWIVQHVSVDPSLIGYVG